VLCAIFKPIEEEQAMTSILRDCTLAQAGAMLCVIVLAACCTPVLGVPTIYAVPGESPDDDLTYAQSGSFNGGYFGGACSGTGTPLRAVVGERQGDGSWQFDFPDPPTGYAAGDIIYAVGDYGAAVGISQQGLTQWAVYWLQDATGWTQGVALPQGTYTGSKALAVDFNANTIGGVATDGTGQNRPVLWAWSGSIYEIIDLMAGTNGNGKVLGSSSDGETFVGYFDDDAYAWAVGGDAALPRGSYTQSRAVAVDSSGAQVVGSALTAGGRKDALRWRDEPGGWTFIALATDAEACAISPDGELIGGTSLADGTQAFVYADAVGALMLVDALTDQGADLSDWSALHSVMGIGSVGDGTYTIVGDGFYNGTGPAQRAFIVQGVDLIPEPATTLLLAVSAALLKRRRENDPLSKVKVCN